MGRVLIAATSLLFAVTACGGGSPTSGHKSPVNISGSLTLSSGGSIGHPRSGQCYGLDGYDDIREGASVTVTDSTGKTVGVGSLGTGVYDPDSYSCRFLWSVDNVGRSDFYRVEVSHRGSVTFPYKVATSGNADLTLGD